MNRSPSQEDKPERENPAREGNDCRLKMCLVVNVSVVPFDLSKPGKFFCPWYG